MPPRPRPRLDMFLVATGPRDAAVQAVKRLWALAVGDGVIGAAGRAGEHASRWVEGGFVSAQTETSDGLRWFHAGQGGTRVSCPVTGLNVVTSFNDQMAELRSGGGFVMACGACGGTHDLSDLDFRPPATFGYAALVLRDVANAGLLPDFLATPKSYDAMFEVVLHRPSY